MTTHNHAADGLDTGANAVQDTDSLPLSHVHVDFSPLWNLTKRLPTYLRLSTALVRDSRVPGVAKASLALGGLYALSPVDLIPGLIPVAGQIDDVYVVLTGLQQAVRLTPAAVVDEHLAAFGLAATSIDDDLATLRRFVRQGMAWSLHQGGKVVRTASRQTRTLMHHARALGSTLR